MFNKYNSIENSYRKEILDRIKGHGLWKNEFLVQEKVHGANLSYWTQDGIHFRAAKRTELIADGEKFYNYDKLLEALSPHFQKIWEIVQQEDPEINQMGIFGEVIGGTYPHKEVERDRLAVRVQKGIHYSPSNHFYAFDIQINGDHFLDTDRANQLFQREGLLHARTLFRGSIEACLEYPNAFTSTLPDQLGLPVLEPNICEGVVIRPAQTTYLNNGMRVMLKNKNEKWAENRKHHRVIKPEEPLSERVVQLQEAIAGYVTENRLHNVVSKIGEVGERDIGRVLGLFNKDVFEDFVKDYGTVFTDLEKKEQKMITKSIGRSSATLVKQYIRCQ